MVLIRPQLAGEIIYKAKICVIIYSINIRKNIRCAYSYIRINIYARYTQGITYGGQMSKRTERDSMGTIEVDADRLWGAQTQRSLENFNIGEQIMPIEVVRAIILLKKCAAIANFKAGKLDEEISLEICKAADRAMMIDMQSQFPLSVWQTGSGTQTNMNVNEVISNLCKGKISVHPNDHVNMSQSTNDVFPSAIHIAAVSSVKERLMPALNGLIDEFKTLRYSYNDTIKSGRTHLQDATPVYFSDEVYGWQGIVENALEMIEDATKYLLLLPIGGTAVGSGINAPKGFAADVVEQLKRISGYDFKENINKFHGLSSKDALCNLHGALKNLATGLMKIANDIRWLASGPRTGLGEINLPKNEPGSSIMPGKVNPTQCEALTMVAAEVMGNDVSVAVACSQGNFELNVYMPLIAFKVMESLNILTDSIISFKEKCVRGITVNEGKMQENLEKSLMLATALTPVLGYDLSAQIVGRAEKENKTLREICVSEGYMNNDLFDIIMSKAMKYDKNRD